MPRLSLLPAAALMLLPALALAGQTAPKPAPKPMAPKPIAAKPAPKPAPKPMAAKPAPKPMAHKPPPAPVRHHAPGYRHNQELIRALLQKQHALKAAREERLRHLPHHH